MSTRFVRVIAAACLGVATLAVAQTTLRPGEYEITLELRVPEVAQPITETRNECITPEEAADFFKQMRADVAAAGEECKLAEPVISGNKATWDSDCEGGVTAKSEITFTADGFSGVVRSVSDGNTFPINIKARWIGATCTDDDDDDE